MHRQSPEFQHKIQNYTMPKNAGRSVGRSSSLSSPSHHITQNNAFSRGGTFCMTEKGAVYECCRARGNAANYSRAKERRQDQDGNSLYSYGQGEKGWRTLIPYQYVLYPNSSIDVDASHGTGKWSSSNVHSKASCIENVIPVSRPITCQSYWSRCRLGLSSYSPVDGEDKGGFIPPLEWLWLWVTLSVN